jgi:thiol:disulfide interchange protein
VRDIRNLINAAWKRREPVFWALLVTVAVGAQWPMLKGWFYRATGAPEPSTSITWRTDLSSALGEARARHSLVLVEFSASWCPPCIAMKHEVWPDPRVTAAVNASFVPVKVDIDADSTLSDRYDVPAIPAVLVLDASGKLVRRYDGYLPLDGMLQFLAPRSPR